MTLVILPLTQFIVTKRKKILILTQSSIDDNLYAVCFLLFMQDLMELGIILNILRDKIYSKLYVVNEYFRFALFRSNSLGP